MRIGRVVLIIQARMGSTRLPGKSMMLLAGRPLVKRIIERVQRCGKIDTIVLATTRKPDDDVLCTVAAGAGVGVFRGSENDLVDRYYQAAVQFGADYIVRLPADNPVVEPGEIDRIVEHYLMSDDDFSSNLYQILENGYPDGLGAEVFSLKALSIVRDIATEPRNREHPHTYFYEHPEMFKIGTVQCPREFSRPDLVLDVNTQDQFDFIERIYDSLYPEKPDFHVSDIIRWYDAGGKKYLPGAHSSSG